MKLRPRTKVPTNNGGAAAAPVPVVPPNTTHLQSRPISLSDTSSSVEDDSDLEEIMEPFSPAKDMTRPKTTVRAAPLTENNLEILQEEITSSEEVQSQDKSSPPPPTPSTRLVQARDFLLAENLDTCPELPTRIQQIADYLQEIPRETRKTHSGVYHEVKNLLRSHRFSLDEREKSHRVRKISPLPSKPPTPLLPTAGEDDKHNGGDERADPFEWTNKLDDLIDAVRLDPDNLNQDYMMSQVRELARPLNGGRLPDADQAGRLINEQVVREHAGTEEKEKEKKKDVEGEKTWASFPPERDLPWEKKKKKERHDNKFSTMDREVGRDTTKAKKGGDEEGAKKPKKLALGLGSYMPREVRDFDWERDRASLLRRDEGNRRDAGSEDGDGEEAQILLAETPFLQWVMGGQVRRDLEGGTFVISCSNVQCPLFWGRVAGCWIFFFFFFFFWFFFMCLGGGGFCVGGGLW